MNEMAVFETQGARTVACPDCSMFQLCIPLERREPDLALLERIVKRRRTLRRGEHLYRPGEPFLFVYAVRSGSFKTYQTAAGGRRAVTGFSLPGELLGLDAIDSERHTSGAQALETASVCELPINRLEELGGTVTSVQRQLLRLVSWQLRHQQQQQIAMCRQGAEERLAAFLLELAQRYARHGFSGEHFRLGMTRADIGDYLGIAKETVSRLFTRLQEQGLIAILRRQLRILDPHGLKRLAGFDDAAEPPAGAGRPASPQDPTY